MMSLAGESKSTLISSAGGRTVRQMPSPSSNCHARWSHGVDCLHRFPADSRELDPGVRAIAPCVQVRLGRLGRDQLRPHGRYRRDVSAVLPFNHLLLAGCSDDPVVVPDRERGLRKAPDFLPANAGPRN